MIPFVLFCPFNFEFELLWHINSIETLSNRIDSSENKNLKCQTSMRPHSPNVLINPEYCVRNGIRFFVFVLLLNLWITKCNREKNNHSTQCNKICWICCVNWWTPPTSKMWWCFAPKKKQKQQYYSCLPIENKQFSKYIERTSKLVCKWRFIIFKDNSNIKAMEQTECECMT